MKTIKQFFIICLLTLLVKNAHAQQNYYYYEDHDGDGYPKLGSVQKISKNFFFTYVPQPNEFTQLGFPALPNDCDDTDPLINIKFNFAKDEDGDSWYKEGTIREYCPNEVPEGFILVDTAKGVDCDDKNALAFPRKWFRPCPCFGPGCATGGRDTLSCVDLTYLGYTRINLGPCTPKGKNGGGSPTQLITFNISPNPATSVLRVMPDLSVNERVEITVSDQFGRVRKAIKAEQFIKMQPVSVNISDLTPGYYQLTIRYGQYIESKKISIKM